MLKLLFWIIYIQEFSSNKNVDSVCVVFVGILRLRMDIIRTGQ